MLENF